MWHMWSDTCGVEVAFRMCLVHLTMRFFRTIEIHVWAWHDDRWHDKDKDHSMIILIPSVRSFFFTPLFFSFVMVVGDVFTPKKGVLHLSYNGRLIQQSKIFERIHSQCPDIANWYPKQIETRNRLIISSDSLRPLHRLFLHYRKTQLPAMRLV